MYSIQIDSNVYLFKSIRNRKDSIAILTTAIGGKVSVYTPPLESGLTAIFVEKGGASYELLQKIVEVNEKKFYRNEYREYLQSFFLDCPSITKPMLDRLPFVETSIMQIVSLYNQSCGWEKENRSKTYNAKLQFGLELEVIHYNSSKGASNNYFEGNRPASGFGLGVYARLSFARRKTSFLISELTFDQISGGGEISYYVNVPVYEVITEQHNFDIKEIRNTYSAYFNIARLGNMSLSAGGGILFQYQLSNLSTVHDLGNNTTKSSASPQDKFGISPIVNVLFDVGRIGLGYQLVFLATQLKGVEGLHLEHKIFLQTRLSKK